uniref:Uncharacterized protein n=1 Tax=Meloidogyne incognita TaxID=6306 RepID=A0A914KSS3_MELIC
MLGLLPLELDTGPWTRKSSTLCSLLLLLTIAALAVPGQVNSEEVGFGKHTMVDKKVTLAPNTVTSDKVDVVPGSCKFKELYPDACDVTIKDGYIELRYNYGSKGCTVDLLSENAANDNLIKFTTGVRHPRGGDLTKCLAENPDFVGSHNNILPFVYSVDNTVIEHLNNKGPYTGSGTCSDGDMCSTQICMQWTFLEVSWSRSKQGKYFAFTHPVGEVASQSLKQAGTSTTFNLTINSSSTFTMHFSKPELFNNEKAACVPKDNQTRKPETWTITKGEHEGKRLLVFSLLRQNATFKYVSGQRSGHPNGPDCELFVRFDVNDYKLLLVNPHTTTSTTTSTTTEAPSTGTSEPPETTTAPSGSSSTTLPTTDNSFPSIKTTSRTTTRRPEQQECGGGLYTAIGIAAAGIIVGIIIAVLVWLWMKGKAGKDTKKGGKQDAERAEEDRLLALYKAEEKTKGKKALGTFAAWKKNRKESETKTAVGLPSIEDELDAIWKRVEKKKAMDKLQYLVDQFEKRKDKELLERGYKPELKKKGLAAVGSFEEWKKKKNIAATFTLNDGTRTAIEYEQPKVIEKIVEVERIIIEKDDEWTIEENPTIEEQERLAEIKAANRGAVDGVEVPKSEEEPEPVDERWIPPSEPNNNPREEI